MEEDTSAKAAPVTRLRRRLSTELQDDVKSPATPSTPTKKRIGRLAAKPQLELIDENSSDITPRKGINKTTAKEVSEIEEKPITPSRRSTRVKSNTSIVFDTTLNVDSPRARRAARRSSQIGSDSESVTTPVKQTRRTRKDSTSSVDKQEPATPVTTIIGEAIAEELDNNSQKSKEVDDSVAIQNKSVRKSPRLKEKQNNSKPENDAIKIAQEPHFTVTETEESFSPKQSAGPESNLNVTNDENKTKSTTANIQYDTKQIEHSLNNNKSISLTFISQNSETVTNSHSDEEKFREKKATIIDKPVSSEKTVHSSACNDDNFLDASVHDENNPNKLATDVQENTKYLVENSNQEALIVKSSQRENNEENVHKQPRNNLIPEIISVTYYDSDSNGPEKNTKQLDNEDQCVPVVVNSFSIEKSSRHDNVDGTRIDIPFSSKTNEKPSFNNSCEPMDIDETVASIISVSDNKPEDCKQQNSRKSEVYSSRDLNTNKNVNQSKQESISSLSLLQNGENAENENKSTLILSQLKDISTTENSLTKFSKSINTEFLSKSANNNTNKEKEIYNKNLSLDYKTSTPLQQKSSKKLGMQINTSRINTPKCAPKIDSSEESESENESSKEVCNMIDEEAVEANEDYESGDSQDEEEKQYELENEIVEKGETLTSEDDEISDDSDYEKDSFIVSSNEEDDELLSGSGDDLSMSDNELTMSKKSKKKYNERKMREQKKASREMFEARHSKSNNSSNLAKATEKNKRLRLESSTLDSEEEIITGSKKSKRLRLDSTQLDNTIKTDSHSTKNTNENRGLSASVCSDNGTRENEISTTFNASILEKRDPLLTHVKLESQTPLKQLNITCVPINDDIEEIQVNTNTSMIKTNETSDPLREASEESNDSSISENVEISANYEALLKVLTNEMGDRKTNSFDMSLNLNEKNKSKEPIVKQLNITETKISKKNKVSKAKVLVNNNVNEQYENCDDSSTDDINWRLLFSDDSVDSVQKEQETKQDSFIPLSKTEGTTTPEANEITKERPSLANGSKKNNKKNKSLNLVDDQIDTKLDETANSTLNTSTRKKQMSVVEQYEHKDGDATIGDDNVTVFIDTKGNRSDPDVSLNTSTKKKKRKSICPNDGSDQTNDNIQTEVDKPGTIFMDIKDGGKKKKEKTSISVNDETDQANDNVNIEIDKNVAMFIDTKGNRSDTDMSINNSAKKKKKESINANDESVQANDNVNTEMDNSFAMFIDTKGNRSDTDMSINNSTKKKKKKSICVNDESHQVNIEIDSNALMFIDTKGNKGDTNMSINNSAKKKKKKSLCINDGSDQASDNVNTEIDTKGNRSDTNISINNSAKKKKKKSLYVNNGSDQAIENVNTEMDNNRAMFIDTKGNRSDTNMSINNSPKKKKKKSTCINDGSNQVYDNVTTEKGETLPMSIDTKGNKSGTDISLNTGTKKKKKPISVNDVSEQDNDNDGMLLFIDTEDEHVHPTDPPTSTSSTKKGNKKKKAPASESEPIAGTSSEANSNEIRNSKKRKREQSATLLNKEVSTNAVIKKHSKKRKRDDDEIEKSAKLFKRSSPEKINIPRLPTAFLNQLNDKLNEETLKAKKSKVISTAEFIVEDNKIRRNKPSNYLEESVCLNDSHEENKKQKGLIIPKVLPFIPTASTSVTGFTTKFMINVVPKETKFVAQTNDITGFKNKYLEGKIMKRMRTYETYKTQRNAKMKKF